MKKTILSIIAVAVTLSTLLFTTVKIDAHENNDVEYVVLQNDNNLFVEKTTYNKGKDNEYQIINVNNQGYKTVFDSRTMKIKNENGEILSTLQEQNVSDIPSLYAYYGPDYVASHWVLVNTKWTTMDISTNSVTTTASILISACAYIFGWSPGASLAAGIASSLISAAISSGVEKADLKEMTFGNSRVISDFAYLTQAYNAGSYVKTLRYDTKLGY